MDQKKLKPEENLNHKFFTQLQETIERERRYVPMLARSSTQQPQKNNQLMLVILTKEEVEATRGNQSDLQTKVKEAVKRLKWASNNLSNYTKIHETAQDYKKALTVNANSMIGSALIQNLMMINGVQAISEAPDVGNQHSSSKTKLLDFRQWENCPEKILEDFGIDFVLGELGPLEWVEAQLFIQFAKSLEDELEIYSLADINKEEWETIYKKTGKAKWTMLWENEATVLLTIYARIFAQMAIEKLGLDKYSTSELNSISSKKRPKSPSTTEPALFDENTDIVKIPTSPPMFSLVHAFIHPERWKEKDGIPYYKHQASNNRSNYIEHCIIEASPKEETVEALAGRAAWEIVQKLGITHAYIHLIFGAYAMRQSKPWQQRFGITGTTLMKILRINEKRSDLPKAENLRRLAAVCKDVGKIGLYTHWKEGKLDLSLGLNPMWYVDIYYKGQQKLYDNKLDLTDFEMYVMPGSWTEKFLNSEGAKTDEALFQFGYLAEKVLRFDPYHQKEVAKLVLHTTFVGKYRDVYGVENLLRVMFSDEVMYEAHQDRQQRYEVTQKFYNSLRLIKDEGWEVEFNPSEFPAEILPDWAFKDDKHTSRWKLPKNYWDKLLRSQVRIGPPRTVQEHLIEFRSKSSTTQKKLLPATQTLSGAEIRIAREAAGMSLRTFGSAIGKSRTWVQKVENGILIVQPEDVPKIKEVLNLPK